MIIRPVLLLSLLLLALPPTAHAALEPLARPTELEPAVTFWRRVYTEVTTSEGFVHDDRRLDIVYETVRLSNSSDNARGTSAGDVKRHWGDAFRYQSRVRRSPSSKGTFAE